MSELYEYIGLSAVFGWLASRVLGLFLPAKMANVVSLLIAAAVMGAQFYLPVWAGFSAIFSPVSLGIAVFALADLARPFGLITRRWSAPELIAMMLLYVAYIYTSLGWAGFDAYGLGYGGYGPVLVAITLGVYAYFRQHLLLALVVAGAQIFWLAGIGSENLFDHLSSALLLPACLVGLSRRMMGR